MSEGGVFFPEFNDLFEAWFRRSEVGARPPFELGDMLSLMPAVKLVGVIVGAGDIGELTGLCITSSGATLFSPFLGEDCEGFEEEPAARDWLVSGGWTPLSATDGMQPCSSGSDSMSLDPTKGEGGTMVTFG